ncbi:MAG: superoxide dismutase [Alistipes sp.]|jgi:Fe-Mn family superoxide dismutase|nr:superoxide dismutase [Alistipes sp.]
MTTINQLRAPFEMPALPWAKDALAPHISTETIDYHYGKHLQTYVNNLNGLVTAGSEFAEASLEDIVRRASGPTFNNAAQVWNHTLYFLQLSPAPLSRPTGRLAEAIDRDFGSFEGFVEKFTASALGLFGSGWTWLTADGEGKLAIENESNAGNPLAKGRRPIMVIDVWEHAYYIDHRNARAASIGAFWKIIDWKVAQERY